MTNPVIWPRPRITHARTHARTLRAALTVLVGGCAGQVAGLLEGGEISVDTPVMVEGMQGFAPLRDFVRMYGLEDELVLPHDGSWPPTQTLSFRLGFPYAAYVLGIGGGPARFDVAEEQRIGPPCQRGPCCCGRVSWTRRWAPPAPRTRAAVHAL
jgi:hypothetical protein